MEHEQNCLRSLPKKIRQLSDIRCDFGLRLLDLMARRNVGVHELAAWSGFRQSYIEALLRGAESAPSIEIVRGLSFALGYPVSYFSPATDIDAAAARDDEIYLDWLRMQRVERGEE